VQVGVCAHRVGHGAPFLDLTKSSHTLLSSVKRN
jgi:hypothetical protein